MRQLKIISRIRSPYGGVYTWKDPLLPLSQPVIGTTWEMLIGRAMAQRYANHLVCGSEFESEVEKGVCRDYPNECYGHNPDLPRPVRHTVSDVIQFMKFEVRHKLAGSPMVTQEEANRRAKICSTCDYNVQFTKGCARCNDLSNMVKAIVGTKSTPYDDELRSCDVCHCFTKVAVWIPNEITEPDLTDDQKNRFKAIAKDMIEQDKSPCWKV